MRAVDITNELFQGNVPAPETVAGLFVGFTKNEGILVLVPEKYPLPGPSALKKAIRWPEARLMRGFCFFI